MPRKPKKPVTSKVTEMPEPQSDEGLTISLGGQKFRVRLSASIEPVKGAEILKFPKAKPSGDT